VIGSDLVAESLWFNFSGNPESASKRFRIRPQIDCFGDNSKFQVKSYPFVSISIILKTLISPSLLLLSLFRLSLALLQLLQDI
jgi:hypothetical protein